jgi:hypothetical protein
MVIAGVGTLRRWQFGLVLVDLRMAPGSRRV